MTWQERVLTDLRATIDTQVPVPVACDLLVVQAPGCLLWTSNVRLHRTGVLFDVSVVCTEAFVADLGPGRPDLLSDADDPSLTAARVAVEVDGVRLAELTWRPEQPAPPDGVALVAVEAAAHGTGAWQSWWVPLIARYSMVVSVDWPAVDVAGEVVWSTGHWAERARDVLSL
ncbi:hypothetical protein [Nocardioides rubriscoriae]|uniref:hypothetical protein n=1 Tax=Nocardioides rubriscoriae TaxID=642762 RepID=UPI0011DFB14C|nr:hypothetical protein [Nocardioides rubriscoriae]